MKSNSHFSAHAGILKLEDPKMSFLDPLILLGFIIIE